MAWKAFKDPQSRSPSNYARKHSLYLMQVGTLFSIFNIYLRILTHSCAWGPTEQNLGTRPHLDEKPTCLTHTVITSLKNKEFYVDLPL